MFVCRLYFEYQGRGEYDRFQCVYPGCYPGGGGRGRGIKPGRSAGTGDQEQDEPNETDGAYVPVQF